MSIVVKALVKTVVKTVVKTIVKTASKTTFKTSTFKAAAISIVLLAGGLTTSAWAGDRAPDVPHGKVLHEKNCMKCHDNRQYTRPNRIIHTFEDLRARVEFCDTASNASFSFDDLDDVVEYLNVNFYKFQK